MSSHSDTASEQENNDLVRRASGLLTPSPIPSNLPPLQSFWRDIADGRAIQGILSQKPGSDRAQVPWSLSPTTEGAFSNLGAPQGVAQTMGGDNEQQVQTEPNFGS